MRGGAAPSRRERPRQSSTTRPRPTALPRLLAAAVLLLLVSGASRAAVEWAALSAPHVRVLHPPGHESVARRALDTAQEAAARVEVELGVAPDRPITVILHRSHADFARAAGTRRRDLVVGIAIAEDDTAHVDASGGLSDVDTVVAHEVAHLLLAQAVKNARVPRWLDEGYAGRASGALEWAARKRLADALARGGLLPLDELEERFPRDDRGVGVAYDQSHALVAYILEHAPPGALPDLVRRLRSGEAFPDALARSTGRAPAAWDAAWRRDFRGRFRWHPWVALGAGASGIVMALLCVLAFRAIRRRKEQLPE